MIERAEVLRRAGRAGASQGLIGGILAVCAVFILFDDPGFGLILAVAWPVGFVCGFAGGWQAASKAIAEDGPLAPPR